MKKFLSLFIALLASLQVFGQAGLPDRSFSIRLSSTNHNHAIGEQSDGKIILNNNVGPLTVGSSPKFLYRVFPDGTTDTSFHPPYFFSYQELISFNRAGIIDVHVMPDDRLLVGGDFLIGPSSTNIYGNQYNTYNLAMLHPDGRFDSSFSFMTGNYEEVILTIFINQAGEIILGGWSIFAKISPTGAIDPNFSPNFGALFSTVETIDQMANGDYIVGGDFGFSKLVRCFPNGDIDWSWNTGTGFNGPVKKVIVQPDQKIIVAGNFTSFNNMTAHKVCRLNPDGTLDTTFNAGVGTNPAGEMKDAILQDDGKIVVGGHFVRFNNRAVKSLVRLHPDGSIDTTFGGGLGLQSNGNPGVVEKLQILNNGRLLASGWFFNYEYSSTRFFTSWGAMKFYLCSDTNLVQTVTACDSFTWIDGNTYTASNDSATFTYTSVGGCDSTITLNLTIYPSYHLIDSVTAFDTYTWVDGITYTADTDTPSMHYTSIHGCDSTISLHLTIATNTWDGTAWNAGQPPQNTNAIIAGNLSNSMAFTAKNLTINNGISLSLDAGQDIYLNGHLENHGTLDIAANTLVLAGQYSGSGSIRSNGGSIVLNGAGIADSLRFDQTTDGNTNLLDKLTLNRLNGGEVTIANKLNIAHQLVLNEGIVHAGGFLNLKSTSDSATVNVVGGTNASITGNVTVERYLPWTSGDHNGFRFVSHPLSLDPIINSVSNLPVANNTLITFNEANDAYQGISNRSATWPQAMGYGVWTNAENTLQFTGSLQLSDVTSINLSNAANRWNYVGNPFPSTIQWQALTTNDMQNAFWVWVKNEIIEGGGAWASYVAGVGANGGSPYIAPMQGFMVRALSTGTPSIAFPADARMSSQAPAFQRTQALGDVYRVKVTKAANNSSMETVIRFHDQASANHDAAYDAEFVTDFVNATPDLYTTDANGIKYSINALPQIGSSPVLVPLQLETFGAGEYSFTFDASQWVSGTNVQLEDTKQGIFTPLVDGQVVNFTATANDAVNRFRLHFNGLATSVANNQLDLIQIYVHEGALYIRGTERAHSLRILDISGRSVYQAQQLELDGTAIRPNLAKGTYMVQLVNETGVKTVKVIF